MRLFAAVSLSAQAADVLADAVRELRGLPAADRLRWSEPDGWHLTVAFYGETAPDVLPALTARLARVATRRAPFELSLSGGGRFGDRVLWAGVAGDREALARLAGAAAAAGRRAGVSRQETRRFHPHLTLARTRNRGPRLAPYAAALASLRSDAWRVTRLTLLRSDLPASGTPGERPRYTVQESWPLGA